MILTFHRYRPYCCLTLRGAVSGGGVKFVRNRGGCVNSVDS